MTGKPLFHAEYTYDRTMLRVFCRVHLWYHKKQHPLFLAVPGVFLASALLASVIRYIATGTRPEPNQLTRMILIGIFSFFLLWLGLVTPYVFRKTMLMNLGEPEKLSLKMDFYEDQLRAVNSLAVQALPYKDVKICYVTQHYMFLYGMGDAAMIVPYESIPEEKRSDFQHFMQEKLKGKLRVRKYAEVFIR